MTNLIAKKFGLICESGANRHENGKLSRELLSFVYAFALLSPEQDG